MKQVNPLIALGLCATQSQLPKCLTTLLIVTENICFADFLDIIYVCHLAL